MTELQDATRALIELSEKVKKLRREAVEAHDKEVSASQKSGERSTEAVDLPTPEGYSKVVEGTAAVLARLNEDGSQEVFYNPVQVVNRDLSTLVIRGYNDLRKEKPQKKGREKDKGLRILEGLSATGLRAIRYWKEIPDIDMIIVNDLLPDAVDAINRNLAYNKVPHSKVIANCDDAVVLMQRLAASSPDTLLRLKTSTGTPAVSHPLCSEKMDVVDLDPYGTAAPFLDSAIACAEEGALLCVTCTDCDVLCGVHPEACHHKYGAISVKAKYCHELAVRILLACIERHAIRHGKFIEPMASFQIDFYVRVFIRVSSSKAETKLSIAKVGHVLQCSQCCAFRTKPIGNVRVEEKSRGERRVLSKGKRKRDELAEQENKEEEERNEKQEKPTAAVPPVPSRTEPRLKYTTATTVNFASSVKPYTVGCNVCSGSVWVGGPIWTGPTHNKPFVERLITLLDANTNQFAAHKRVRALLAAARDELPDCPLFYKLDTLSANVHTATIPFVKFNSALLNLGYRTSQVHCCPEGIKTDAPPEVVYDIIKAWRKSREKDDSSQAGPLTGFSKQIMERPANVEVDFSFHKGSDVRAKVTGESKWGKVYEPGWGPKARAKGTKDKAKDEVKDTDMQ